MKIFIALVVGLAVLVGGYFLISSDIFKKSAGTINQISNQSTGAKQVILKITRVEVSQGVRDFVDGKVKTEPAIISIFDADNKLINTISSEDGIGTIFARVSPTGEFLYYGWGRGDGHNGTFYSVTSNASYSVGLMTTMEKWGWLQDGKFEYWSGCIVAGDCRRMRSVDAKTPWVFMEVVSDGAAFIE